MATITSRETVDAIIANDGLYPGDSIRVTHIIEYENIFDGGTAFGLVYEGEDPDNYLVRGACVNPRTIWSQRKELVKDAAPEQAEGEELLDASYVLILEGLSADQAKELYTQLNSLGSEELLNGDMRLSWSGMVDAHYSWGDVSITIDPVEVFNRKLNRRS